MYKWKTKDGISIPDLNSPQGKDWYINYVDSVVQNEQLKNRWVLPCVLPIELLNTSNGPINTDRYKLYKSLSKYQTLPPILVEKQGVSPFYHVCDGNHRVHASRHNGLPGIPCLVRMDSNHYLKNLPTLVILNTLVLTGSVPAAASPLWTTEGLNPELVPIAYLESKMGLYVNHTPNHKGVMHTAYGALGLKPITAYEEYLRNWKKLTPSGQLSDTDFLDKMTNDIKFYNTIASLHWGYLKRNIGSVKNTAYAWRYGIGAALGSNPQDVDKSEYVGQYVERLDKMTKNVFKILKENKSRLKSDNVDAEIPRVIRAGSPENHPWIGKIQEAINVGNFKVVRFDGTKDKTFVVVKADNQDILLKPSATLGAAKGIKGTSIPEAYREEAFYKCAKAFNINDLPHASSITMDEKLGTAVVCLDSDWKTLDSLRDKELDKVQKLLQPYVEDGTLHTWAMMDYVLGNPDRHGNNIMGNFKTNKVMLIDHGTTMADKEFDPANDKDSFVPFYLRAWYQPRRFKSLTRKQKIKYMPKASKLGELKIKALNIEIRLIENICLEYGFDFASVYDRYLQIRGAQQSDTPSLVINGLWV